VTIWAALTGGLVGTLMLTTTMRAATELRLTRIDLPFLLGTAFTTNRIRAAALGYALHFGFGLAFACGYYLVLEAINDASWWLGAVLGVVHALFAGTALVNILLPLVHPRMGTRFTDATSAPLLSRPASCSSTTGRGRRPSWSPPMSSTGRSSARSPLPRASERHAPAPRRRLAPRAHRSNRYVGPRTSGPYGDSQRQCHVRSSFRRDSLPMRALDGAPLNDRPVHRWPARGLRGDAPQRAPAGVGSRTGRQWALVSIPSTDLPRHASRNVWRPSRSVANQLGRDCPVTGADGRRGRLPLGGAPWLVWTPPSTRPPEHGHEQSAAPRAALAESNFTGR
jgi:hypothetical protein